MAKRKQVISDYEPPAHTTELTGVTFPASWSESARLMAFRRNMTQADVDDIEARLAAFRALRDWYAVTGIRARLPEYEAQIIEIESELPTLEAVNRKRLQTAQTEHNPFMRAIKIKQANEAEANALADWRGRQLAIRAQIALCEQALERIEKNARPLAA